MLRNSPIYALAFLLGFIFVGCAEKSPPLVTNIEILNTAPSSGNKKIDEIESLIRQEYLFTGKYDPAVCRAMLERLLKSEPVDDAVKNTCFDQYTTYRTPTVYADMTKRLAGNMVGIGIEYATHCATKAELKDRERCPVTIIEVIEESPADVAGLAFGDIIVAVGKKAEEPKTILHIDDVGAGISGIDGEEVILVVRRGRNEHAITVKQAAIRAPSINVRRMGDVCYVEIERFTNLTPSEFDTKPRAICGDVITYMVLDLRNNFGGVHKSDIEMLYNFTEDPFRVLVTERYKNYTTVTSIQDPEKKCGFLIGSLICETYQYPDGTPKFPGQYAKAHVAILINGNTASAAEITAGVLQSWEHTNHKAPDEGLRKVFGMNSYGKVHGQILIPLGDGSAIQITQFEFLLGYRPSVPPGTPITPDVVVEETRQHRNVPLAEDAILRAALEWLHSLH